MIDREKVIEELETCLTASCRGKSGYCPIPDKIWDNLDEVLELLKQPYRFGKWKRIPAGMTPGGTPMYACAECGGTEHLYGTEYPQRYVICEQCGSINTYPYEVTIDEYRETGRKCR